MRVVGVDPGSRTTAVVLREGKACEYVELVERGGDLGEYLMTVVGAVGEVAHWNVDLVAVEDVVNPSWFLDGKEAPLLNLAGLLETAQVLGAIRSHLNCRLVRPAGFGKTPDLEQPYLDAYMRENYPAELLGAGELGGKYTGRLRHARSAWSVSLAGERQTRQQQIGGLR